MAVTECQRWDRVWQVLAGGHFQNRSREALFHQACITRLRYARAPMRYAGCTRARLPCAGQAAAAPPAHAPRHAARAPDMAHARLCRRAGAAGTQAPVPARPAGAALRASTSEKRRRRGRRAPPAGRGLICCHQEPTRGPAALPPPCLPPSTLREHLRGPAALDVLLTLPDPSASFPGT